MYEGNIKVNADFSSVDKAADSVDKLGKAGEKTKGKTDSLTGAIRNIGPASGPIAQAADAVEDIGSRATGAVGGFRALASTVGVAGTALAGIAVAGVSVFAAIEGIGFKMAELADAADESAQKLGLTITQFETMSLLARENGTTVESLTRTYDKLSKSLQKADEDNEKTAQSFEVLQISQSELANKTEKEVAGIIVKRWEELGMSTKATVAAMQLVGPAFREQVPAIKAAADGIDSYNDRVRKFGAAATAELVEKGGKQEKAVSDVGLAWKGLANTIALLSSSMITDTLNWGASMLANVNGVIKGLREAKGITAAMQGSISDSRRGELTKQAEKEVYDGSIANPTGADVNKRLKELMAQEQQNNFRNFEREGQGAASAAADENARLAAQKKASDKVKTGKADKVEKNRDSAVDQSYVSIQGLTDPSVVEKYTRSIEERDAKLKESNLKLAESFKQLADPTRKIRQDMEDLSASLARGEISTVTFDNANLKLQQRLAEVSGEFDKFSSPVAYTSFADGWTYAFDQFKQQAGTAADAGAAAFAGTLDGISDGLAATLTGGKADWKSYSDFVIKEISRILIKQALLEIVGFFTNNGVGTNTTGTSLPTAGGRALGGPALSGTTIPVGENGPELLRMGSTSGNIIPNSKLNSAGGRGGDVNMPISISISIANVDSDDRKNELLKEVKQSIDVGVKQGIAEQLRRGNMLNPVR